MSTVPAELLASYPGIPEALEWAESDSCAPLWDQARAAGFSPEQVVAAHRLAAGAFARACTRIGPDPGLAAVQIWCVRCHEQMGRPEFARYVAGKLGAV